MDKEKRHKKMKQFWEDTEAISPVVATILVLAVAVAAGLGLYLWFNPFQTGVQAQVGNSTTGQIKSMAIDNAKVTIRLENPSLDGIDAANDTTTDNKTGNGAIWYAQNYKDPYSQLGPNGKTGFNAWQDERIIVDIPITLVSNIELNDVKMVMKDPVVNKGALRSGMWLRLDKDNDYQLLKKDGTVFKGFINESKDKVYEDNTNGYTYYFGGKNNIGLNMMTGIKNNDTGTLADNPATPFDDDSLSPPAIPKTNGALRVMELFTSVGSHYWAFARNNTGSELGWITSDYTSDGKDRYFTNSDKLEEMFHSGTYKVADKLAPNEAVTINTYFMVNILSLDNYNTDKDDGSAELVLPFTITTKEGVTETGSATLTIED